MPRELCRRRDHSQDSPSFFASWIFLAAAYSVVKENFAIPPLQVEASSQCALLSFDWPEATAF
jgi:hypothetical protein